VRYQTAMDRLGQRPEKIRTQALLHHPKEECARDDAKEAPGQDSAHLLQGLHHQGTQDDPGGGRLPASDEQEDAVPGLRSEPRRTSEGSLLVPVGEA
jgi:hypothetical protein